MPVAIDSATERGFISPTMAKHIHVVVSVGLDVPPKSIFIHHFQTDTP